MKGFIIAAIMVCSSQIANAKEILLTSKNHCALQSLVNFKSMQKLKFCLADKAIIRHGRDYPIYLVVDSGGGEIYWGLRFIEFAKTINNIETVSIYAASMASAIVQAIPGKRYGTENALVMFHRARATFKGYFEDGEVETQLALWKKIVRKMESVNASRIGITLMDYKYRVVNEWYLYAEDNIGQNTLDEIIVAKCSKRLIEKRRTVTVKTFFGSYRRTISACPLVN